MKEAHPKFNLRPGRRLNSGPPGWQSVILPTALTSHTLTLTLFYMQVSFVPYTDEIASLAGVNPNLWSLLLEDPHLALRCYFGPCIPAQYRLRGPGSWEGAKDVINNIQESTLAPLRTRKVAGQLQSDQSKWKIIFVSLLVLFFAILCYWK